MNTAARLRSPLRPLSFNHPSFAFVLAIGLIAGCAGSEPKQLKPTPLEGITDLKPQIARLRGLEFKQAFTLSDPSKPSPVAEVSEYGAQPVAQLARAYKSIGLLPASSDFARALSEFSRLQHIIAYDFGRHTLAIAPQAARLGQSLAEDSAARAQQIPAILALTYALQEQHFHWQERLQAITIEDRKLPFRAIATGDALLLANNYLPANPQGPLPQEWQAMDAIALEVERLGASLPQLLRDKLVFPYREGSRFVKWALASRGWLGVNVLFADPPLSSAQILHPEKYYRERETPLRILPFGFIRQMRDSSVIDQTIGAYLIQRLLAGHSSRAQAMAIASGWRGDSLSAYDEGGNLITTWYSAWRADESAEAFIAAFRDSLERRQGIRFRRTGNAELRWQGNLPTGRLTLLQRKGSWVFFAEGLLPDRANTIGEKVWTDFEIGPEPTSFPFDSARGPAHLSFRSR